MTVIDPALHWESIGRLQALCFPADAPVGLSPADLWVGAFIGKDLVGFTCFSWIGLWYYSRAGVLPRARGQGLQLRMLRRALRETTGLVVSDCTNSNPASAVTMVKAGMMPYWPSRPWGLPHSIYWRLDR